MGKQITLFFQSVRISFMETSEMIRGKRYDFSQFGPLIGGEGDGWEDVAAGFAAASCKPTKDNKDG